MDYTEINTQLKDYFCNLLIAQYRSGEKNRKFVELLYDVVFADSLALQIKNECLNVEESIGKQLDTVGEWVGVTRDYDNSIIWDRAYFSFVNWNNTPNILYQGGFSNYVNFEYLDGYTMTWKHLQELSRKQYKLEDKYYRDLIKLKIIKNSIKHTKKNIDDAIYTWSNGNVYTTWQSMRVIYNYNVDYSQIIGLALQKNCLPCPTGCEISTHLI